MKKTTTLLCLLIVIGNYACAQAFTRADTLRGSNGPGREWWDATDYNLHINFHIKDSTISGYNEIGFKEIQNNHVAYFQIDLQEPLVIDSVLLHFGNPTSTVDISPVTNIEIYTQKLNFIKEGNTWLVYLSNEKLDSSKINRENGKLRVYYHGKPKAAVKAPWDGGVVWKKDKQGAPFIGVACQGLGASVWFPCKDYQGDEPDSASIHITAPSALNAISNGRKRNKKVNEDGTTTTSWAVVNPINNYDISPYLGKYVHFNEIYKGEKGNLTMDYWVLDSNLVKAKKQFKDAPKMMEAFEYWFGPYPFYKDGYKLVESPYLGMEHQSAIAYGNDFKNGYKGSDLSGSGQGLKWDFIIIHESGHEWFGNNITTIDIADMWVHEGFTNYSETLFTEYYYGKEAATEYVVGIRKNIQNDIPIIAPYGVQQEGSGDMYYKAANMIHTIRQIINNDEKFRSILRGMNKIFRHQTVTGSQIQEYINKRSGIDFSKVFEQYLTTTKIPVLEYKNSNGTIYYRWSNCVGGFNMPVKIYNNSGKLFFIHPTTQFKKAPKDLKDIQIDVNFYVKSQKV